MSNPRLTQNLQQLFARTSLLTLAVAAAATVTPAAVASAAPGATHLPNARLAIAQQVYLDPTYNFASVSGTIEKNGKTIAVYAKWNNPCKPGQVCPMIAREPLKFSAPIVKRETSCGSQIFTASKDQRPVDGNLIEITLTDNSKRTCRDTVAGKVVVNVVETFARGGNRHESMLISRDGFITADFNKIDFKTEQNTFTIDEKYSEQIFGRAFHVQEATLEKTLQSHLILNIKPHTIYCAQMIGINCPNPQTFSADLAITEVKTDGCGSLITVARGNVTLQDGTPARATLTVQDNSTRLCEDYRPNLSEVSFDVHVDRNDVAHNFFGSDARLK